MKYIEWNNCIASHFFSPLNAGKDTYLYITKLDVINFAKQIAPSSSDDSLWKEFLNRIQCGLPGSNRNSDIIDKAIYSYEQWRRNIRSVEGVEVKFPPYIMHLAFFVLPLTEIQGNYNANNYYDRLNDFLIQNGVNQNLKNRLKELEPLWVDLVKWANFLNNGDKGFFRLSAFIHPNWIYVGKPFSQCIIPPKVITKLPALFLEAGMVPHTFYDDKEISNFLSLYGQTVLGLSHNAISLIRKSNRDELGQSVIEIVKREYSKWKGESYESIEEGTFGKMHRNYTTASFRLQFKINENAGKIFFSYRMFSSTEYPDDLQFSNNIIIYERDGFSRTIQFPFKDMFEFTDEPNKWKSKFPYKDIRLFVGAGTYQLSTEYWIETDQLSRTEWVLVFCKNRLKETISEWAMNNCAKFVDESDLENMPSGYSLLKILCPRKSHPGLTVLTVFKEKSIEIIHALKVNFRTFLYEPNTLVEIKNSDGNEQVYLQYRSTDEKVWLKKRTDYTNKWMLPSDILLNKDFYIKVEGEVFLGNELAYTIVAADNSYISLNDQDLPKRDAFGRILTKCQGPYALGSNIIGIDLKMQLPYIQFFTGIHEDSQTDEAAPLYKNEDGNAILSFLTLKKRSTTEDFYNAFEFFNSKYFRGNEHSITSYSKLKKASINLYDYLGFIDYEYEKKEILVNAPQFILIPSGKGRTILLIGGRDEALIQRIIETAPEHNLQVEIRKQLQSNKILFLPDAVVVKAFGKKEESYGLKNLVSFSSEVNVKFNPGDFNQISMQLFSAGIEEYQRDLIIHNETDENDYGWVRSIFNPDTLDYEKNDSILINKKFSLIEYKFNEYTFIYKLWLNEKCYSVDRNWGKYVALKYFNKQVILYGNEKVAIPLELPLPRLLAESIVLLSGVAPGYSIISSRQYRIYENIPGPFAHNLFIKLGQKPAQTNL